LECLILNPYQPAVMRFTPRILSLVLLTMLTSLFSNLTAQCPKVISFPEEKAALEITSPWSDGTTTYSGELKLKSTTGVTLSLKSLTLRDADLGIKIDPEQVTLGTPITISPNELQEVRVSVNNVTAPGNYVGTLLLSGRATSGDSCDLELPFTVSLYEPGKVVLVNADAPIAVNTVPESWLNFILPTRIKGTGFSLNVKNEGQSAVDIEDYSLYFQGNYNSNYLSDQVLELASDSVRILPGRTEKVAFRFVDKGDVEIDSYSGQVSLHLADRNETLSASVSLNRRMGVVGALVALLLGIFVGRMMKDLNKQTSQDQVALIEKFIPLRSKAGTLEDKVAKNRLLVHLSETEELINQVKDEATKASAEAALAKTSTLVDQIVEWQALWFRISEVTTNSGLRSNDPLVQQMQEELSQTRDMIFEGNEAGVKERLAKVDTLRKQMSEEMTKSRDVGLSPDGNQVEPPAESPGVSKSLETLTLSMENIAPVDTDQAANTGSSSAFWRRAEDILFRILDVLTGVQVNARVRYAVFRPIAMLVAFTVLVLLGFQEIYVNGSETFGDEGIYDYLKLFLWGVVSDVFSRSLSGTFSGDASITSFVDRSKNPG